MCLQKLYVVDCLGRTLGAIKQKYVQSYFSLFAIPLRIGRPTREKEKNAINLQIIEVHLNLLRKNHDMQMKT
jgi:hypothetical protein